MERIVEQGLLYDFYGDLLTKRQQEIYESAVYEDKSLSELAEEYGISRQGVHDLLKRCNKLLEDYEAKLNLVEKFHLIRIKAERIEAVAQEEEVKLLVRDILDNL